MNTIEAISYFDLISTFPRHQAFRDSCLLVFVSCVITLIIFTFLEYYGKSKPNNAYECDMILNQLEEKYTFIFRLISIVLFVGVIIFAQKWMEERSYQTLSGVKKVDVINSEYFKSLDESKKELIKLYLLCDNTTNFEDQPNADCSTPEIKLDNFTDYIPTHKLITIIKNFESSNFNKSKNPEKATSDNFDEQKALIEYIKNAK